MDLMRYNFVCPQCGKEYTTYVERDKYQQLVARQRRATDIFDDNYPIFYKGIFTIGYCSKCIGEVFDIRGESYCQETDADDDSKIYSNIENMCKV